MNQNIKNKGRSAIYMMAGVYLVYIAYQVFKNRADSAGGEYVAVMLGAVAFFVIGAGMIGFGFYMFYKTGKEMNEAAPKQGAVSGELPETEETEETLDNS